MTVRDTLRSAVDTLTDEQSARVLDFLETIAGEQGRVAGGPSTGQTETADEHVDELTYAEPKLGLSPESSIWRLAGFIKDEGPTDMASDKYAYFPQVYGHSTDE